MPENEHFDHPVLHDIYAAMENLEAAEQLRQEAFEQLQSTVLNLPNKIGHNTELRDAIITYLFWNEGIIRQTWLAKAFDSSPYHIREIAARPALIECRGCRSPLQVTIKNRSGSIGWQEDICADCKEAQSRESHESNDRYYAAREARVQELRTMPYREYLQTPEWQERRQRAMKRAGFRCQVCNAYGVRLNVHHRTYQRRGNEDDRDLITLCQDCHAIFHENSSLASDNGEKL